MRGVAYMMTRLYESSHQRVKNEYKKTHNRLHCAMPETLKLRDLRNSTFVSGESQMKIHGDSEWQCYGKRHYNRKKIEAENCDGSLLIGSWQWTTDGMISKFRKNLYCI